MTLSERLRDLRGQSTLTLKQLSERTGLSIQFLSDLEHGRTKPSLDTLSKLATAYGIRVTTLLMYTAYDEKGGNQ